MKKFLLVPIVGEDIPFDVVIPILGASHFEFIIGYSFLEMKALFAFEPTIAS